MFAFLIKLLIYSALLYFFYELLFKKHIPAKFLFHQTHYIFLLFFTVTILFHYGLLASAVKNNSRIVNYYMMATAIKLFSFLAIIIFYALLNSGNAIAFITNFFVLYIFYTVFEVAVAYRYFKRIPQLMNENSKK